MLIKDAKELRQLTGNYYANNDFSKVVGELEQAREELVLLIGEKVMTLAESGENETLSAKVKRPMAILATLRMYQKNDLSHEDDGRKFKTSTDNGEKLPWEWQLDRDDAMHLESYYRGVDALIRYLDGSDIAEWKESETYKVRQSLIIRNGQEFNRYFPIENSERMYLLLVPFIREAQMLTVKKAYGQDWDSLLTAERGVDEVRYAACVATALLAMSIALHRLPLKLIPSGVIRGYMAENGMSKSQPATYEEIIRSADWMREDAAMWINQMKQLRDGEAPNYDLVPNNNPRNKYCSL